MMSNILYVILTIIVAMIIMLAIGVRRMGKRLDKKIEEVRSSGAEKGGDIPDSSGKIESDRGYPRGLD